MARHDYHGPFDPVLSLADFSRQALATLGREYLLHGHLQDRVGLPYVLGRFGDEAMTQIAIDEWMAASPVYSARMQRALGFVGHDVGTIFKNIQLDIGAAHQFMDFRYRLDSPTAGEFWLARCGALMDVEPFGEARVRSMCHDIEDPTFDATAAAAHPCAKVRPIHRPPRVPSEREPHCHWRVFIDDQAVPYEQHPALERMHASRLAGVPLVPPVRDPEPGGWADYSGPFDPDFQLEDLSHGALTTALQEFAVQSHLLARSFLLCVGERFGDDAVADLATAQFAGIAGITAERLRTALAIGGDDGAAVAKLFQVHPAFHPRTYVALRVAVTDPPTVRLTLDDCPALQEGDPYSWFAHLRPGTAPPAFDAIARAANPRARCRPVPGAGHTWEVVIDPAADPLPEPEPMQLGKLSTGARFVFERRRPLRA